DLADGRALAVDDVEVAGAIDRDAVGREEPRGGAGAVGRAGGAGGAGHGGDVGVRRDLADRVVARVDDVEVAGGVDGERGGGVEARGGAVAVGGARRERGAGERGDHAAGGDLADRLVPAVGDEQVAAGVGDH